MLQAAFSVPRKVTGIHYIWNRMHAVKMVDGHTATCSIPPFQSYEAIATCYDTTFYVPKNPASFRMKTYSSLYYSYLFSEQHLGFFFFPWILLSLFMRSPITFRDFRFRRTRRLHTEIDDRAVLMCLVSFLYSQCSIF